MISTLLKHSLAVARLLCLVWLMLVAGLAAGEPERSFREGKVAGAELRYIGGLPVLCVAGTPAEIGRQKAALSGDAVRRLAGYPKRLLKLIGREQQWPKFVELGRSLLGQFPPDHLAEIRAFSETAGVDRDLGIMANTMIDVYRGGFGCSSLIVEAPRSATGAPLFGRNLDFYTLGIIEKYTLVTVYRPNGKHAFAAIGYPGMFGCVSGINDAGLCLAVHEVYLSRDGAPMFNSRGTPLALCCRRILEECKTVDEAEALLRKTERTTKFSLALCDPSGGAVVEMTPRSIEVRRAIDDVCVCTNHFRTEKLRSLPLCRRYGKLAMCREMDSVGPADVAAKLHQVNQKHLTVQTMIFEPRTLKLHLASGSCPSSALPLRQLDLEPLFAAKKKARK